MLKNPKTLSEVTLDKLLYYLRTLGCSICGWNQASCDIHHIKSRANGGSDLFSNLTYICPNCHRLAHSGLLTEFVTVEQQVEKGWKEFFDERREEILDRFREAKSIKTSANTILSEEIYAMLMRQ